MCGIAGFLNLPAAVAADGELSQLARSMARKLTHRGPDAEGVWSDGMQGIALSHRRLSILDLSEEGQQPMSSACGRYVVAFNGEIYNHPELRQDLSPHAWRGHSDTEVMLEAFSRWGVEKTIARLIGMFAIALWDRQARRLYLMRDRFGEKPLYYGFFGKCFLFGSELKALRAHPAHSADIDRDALASYLRYGYVPSPLSIYRDVRKLPAGCLLEVPANFSSAPVEPRHYWSATQVAVASRAYPFAGTEDDAVNECETLLLDAVGRQCVADVPLGAFLSGGVDSSLIVALMQAHSDRPVRTFTIGFREWGFDESQHAAAVARHLGTEHTEFYANASEALSLIPTLPSLYDEPFSDSSQIPTHLVAQLARRHVTVSLSGDGGDEIFGGYNRYSWGAGIWQRCGEMPLWLRRLVAGGLDFPSPRAWDNVFEQLPFLHMPSTPGDKLHKLAAALRCKSPDALYRSLVSQWQDPASIVLGGRETEIAGLRDFPARQFSVAEQMMLADTLGYLPDDILTKVDRATMGVSLESRAPFLDHRLFEFAWRLPLNMKVRNGQGKWLLRQVLYRHVPQALIERPKMGFGVPIATWLRGPLREWAEELLRPERIRNEGWFDVAAVRGVWEEHLSGKRNRQNQLWAILMFQAWYEQWR